MPWSVKDSHPDCPASHPYAVVKSDTGTKVACHATKDSAEQQVKALYAKEPMTHSAAPRGGEYRSFRFEFAARGGGSADHDDGLTFEGYAAVFNTPTRIQDMLGEFDEVILPGAFVRSLAERTPVLMFEHGKHPLIGSMPLGVITHAAEDTKGLHVQARLSDNWLIQPVRDAVRDGAVDGMSFRFLPPDPEKGERWTKRKGKVDLRELLDIDAPELGPVVFPAYEPTTASVRSLVERLEQQLEDFTGRPDARSAGGGDPAEQPGNGKPAAIRQYDELDVRDRAWKLRRRLTNA